MDQNNKTQNVEGKQKPVKIKKTAGSKVLNAIGAVIIVVLIPILIINGTLLVKSVMNPDKPADFMGYIPFVSGFNNMTDFDGNDLIVMHEQDSYDELEAGDIICYWYSDGVVIERISRVWSDESGVRYSTKADTAELSNPSKVTPNQIIGVYHRHIDDIGTFVLFMQTRLGILVCVVLPIFIICLAFVIVDKKRYHDLVKQMQEENEERERERIAQGNADQSNS